MLLTCQAGYEALLRSELRAGGVAVGPGGGGWLEADATEVGDWCFPHLALLAPVRLEGASVNALAAAIAGFFLESARAERFEVPWPLLVLEAAGLDGLGRRASAVEAVVRETIRKNMARVARLADGGMPRNGRARGLFVLFTDFQKVVVAREAWAGGQRRMADAPAAPSRSYLKVEEAYGVLGREPVEGETVVDLGAAPGGWSFSAASRGARVLAIDNGPLKGGAAEHPGIEHRREDAFAFQPPGGGRVDWLFCDLVEDPHRVLEAIVAPWLRGRWCRFFVVNLKFGRTDAVALLGETRRRLAGECARLVIRHLYHDREEFTLVGASAEA